MRTGVALLLLTYSIGCASPTRPTECPPPPMPWAEAAAQMRQADATYSELALWHRQVAAYFAGLRCQQGDARACGDAP